MSLTASLPLPPASQFPCRYVVHDRDENGLLPLHRATIKAPPSVVQLLVQAGADPEATFEGLASLHMACGRGREGVVEALLQGGANRDARTAQGFTALHCASGRGGLGAVKILLNAGADVNVRSGGWQRRTPLHAAATLGDRAVTEELLRWGAEVDVPDSEGVTSLHIGTCQACLPCRILKPCPTGIRRKIGRTKNPFLLAQVPAVFATVIDTSFRRCRTLFRPILSLYPFARTATPSDP